MPEFPIDPWVATDNSMCDKINSETANATWGGIPVLAIAALRAYPSERVVDALLAHEADPSAIIDGKAIKHYVQEKKSAPVNFKAKFLSMTERPELEAVSGPVRPPKPPHERNGGAL